MSGTDISTKEGFLLTPSPHIVDGASTKKIMYAVLFTLVPAVVFSVLLFGPGILALYLTGAAAAVATEIVVKRIRKRSIGSVADGSAVLTGVLLVMTLPPGIPPFMVVLGAVVAIFIGKEVFGGLGANVFNPALVGRAFLSAAYPLNLTTYPEPAGVLGLLSGRADAGSGATPLAAAKFEGVRAALPDLLLGRTGGSIGETSALLIILGGVVLLALRLIRWRTVLSFLGTVFVLGGLFSFADPGTYPGPLFHLLSGGLLLGAFYMATDPVTSPITRTGDVLFGLGAGVLVIVIRLLGGYPEGVMFSILLMNALTPIIDRYTVPLPFGAVKAGKGGSS